jgi:hypothetical protein
MRTNTPRTFQPTFEGLEDRCLMAAGLTAGLRVIPQLPIAQPAVVTSLHKPILVNGLAPTGASPRLHATGNAATAGSSPVQTTVDLKNSAVGKVLVKLLKSLAQGNKRSAGIDYLTLNKVTGELRGKFWVHHKHKPVSGVTLYSLKQSASFTFNPLTMTATANVNLNLGRGVLLPLQRIVDLLVTVQRHDEYNQVRDSYVSQFGAGNVYFASKEFVNYVSPGTFGQAFLDGLASGGTSVGQALQKAEDVALHEVNEVTAWLVLKGVSEAAATAKAILTGQKVDWPFLAVKWQPVHYFTDIQVVGGIVKADIQVSHGAFALVWQGNP